MPMRARRPCTTPRCPNLQPCATHPPRRPWAGRSSARSRGYTAEYERNRALVMVEETSCWICGLPGEDDDECDHVLELSKGGMSERWNLRRAHRRCNQARRRDRGSPYTSTGQTDGPPRWPRSHNREMDSPRNGRR